MPTHSSISLSICVNGRTLPEFAVEKDSKTNTISCWIPSEVGKEFSIIVLNRYKEDLNSTVSIDGVRAAMRTAFRDKEVDIGVFDESPYVVRKLKFAKAELVDDDRLLQSSKASETGSISVTLHSFLELGQKGEAHSNAPPTNQVHERAKKGITDCIALGQPTISDKPSKTRIIRILQSIAVFHFRYRPLSFLQAQGIAPPPTPSPTQQDVDLSVSRSSPSTQVYHQKSPIMIKEQTKADDEDEDQAEIDALMAKLEEIKTRKRKKNGGTEPRKKAKSEPRPVFIPGEVIDLT